MTVNNCLDSPSLTPPYYRDKEMALHSTSHSVSSAVSFGHLIPLAIKGGAKVLQPPELLGLAMDKIWGLGLIWCARQFLQNPKLAPIEYFKKLALGCVVGMATSYLSNRIIIPTIAKLIPEEKREDLISVDAYGEQLMYDVKGCAILAPFKEELFFRKILQEGIFFNRTIGLFDTVLSKIYRLCATSILFGLVHMRNGHSKRVQQAINAGLLGIVLGALKESRLGLLGSIGAHFAHNFCCWMSLVCKHYTQHCQIMDFLRGELRLKVEHLRSRLATQTAPEKRQKLEKRIRKAKRNQKKCVELSHPIRFVWHLLKHSFSNQTDS